MSTVAEIKEKIKRNGLPNQTKTNSSDSKSSGYTGSSRYQEIKRKAKESGISFKDIGVNQDYINSFVKDANTFFNTAQKDYESVGWGNAASAYDAKNNAYSDLYQRWSNINAWLNANKSKLDEETYNNLSGALSSFKKSAPSVVKSFEQSKKFYSQFDTEDAYNRWSTKYRNEKEIMSAEDFDEYSQIGANIKNPADIADAADTGISIFGHRFFGEEGEDIGNVVTMSRDNADYIATMEANGANMADYGLQSVYRYMTDNEVAIYNYYLGKGDKEKAAEYLNSLTDELNQRWGGKIHENVQGDKFLEMTTGGIAGLDQAVTGLKNLGAYFTGTEGAPVSSIQYASGQVREDLEGGWGVAYDLINTTSNMLPSILVGMVNPNLGAATLGASAMGNAYSEMRRLGYNEGQARGYGFLVGASEAVLSKFLGGISKLGGGGKGIFQTVASKIVPKLDNAIGRVAIQVGGNLVDEGLEEAIQEVLDPVFKMAMTGEDFEGINLEQVLYSGLLGMLSAGVLEGAPSIAGTAVNSHNANKVYGNNVGELVNESLEIDPDNALAARMKTRLDNGKGVSGYQINRLVETNESTMLEQDRSAIQKAAAERLTALGETGDVAELSKALAKYAESQKNKAVKLSPYEKNLIKESENAQKVADDLTGKNSADWTGKIGTNRINYDEYNKGITEETTPTAENPSPAVAKAVSTTENAPATEIATEGKIKASENAKVTIERDGKEVEVKPRRIASLENGKMTIELEGGEVVDAGEINYGATGVGLVYQAAIDMSTRVGGFNTDTANVFVKGYDPKAGLTAAEYVHGFSDAYRFGAMGYPAIELESGVYTSKLTDEQRTTAYNFGKAFGNEKVATKQAKIASTDTIKATKNANKGTKKGNVHFDGSVSGKNLTERQKASLKGLRVIAESLGIDIYVFESPLGKDGKRQGANGWYDPSDNSIHIDLYAGANGDSLMLFTAAHELTHFIREWSPAKFKSFADFLLNEYGTHGKSVEELVRNKMEVLKENGRITADMTEEQAYGLAYEEVIADSCEAMLTDSNAIAKLAELKAKDKTLWDKIKDFITKLVARITKAYEGLDPDSVEGRYVREMKFAAERLQNLWTEALVDAGENFTAAEKTMVENGIEVNSETESASLMSVRYLLDDVQHQKVAEALSERFGVTEAEAKEWLKAETSLASLILNPKYSQYLDYVSDPNEQAIKSNSDYPQGTVDFSNICKKRRDFTEVMNRVLRNFPNHVFEATDLAKIRTIMMQEGMEVACGICYVEDRRQLDSIVAQDFIDSLDLYRKGSKTRPDGKAFNANQLKALKLIEGDSYTPSIYELISLEGRNSLKAKNPAMEEAWVKFNNARGMQSVRLLLNDAEYNRQILKYTPAVVKRKNDLGGLRIYSFSDAEMFHLIDIIQVITDSATVGLSLQGYTKVNEYAKAVKDTGEKLNRSLIPKGDLGYHIEDGKVVLDFDTVEGIDINHPDFFDNIDNPNVGNIVIGINATQIRAAMTSKFIDQIIPFHTGQSNEVLGEKGIAAWANYKDFQSERDLSTGKKSSHQINIYTEVIQAAEAEGNPITNKVEFVNKFLEVCKENNLEPRFSEFLNVDENGNYIYTEGYHKFLVDFKTFDQNTGEYLPQMPVKPIFDNGYITQLLKDYVKSQKVKDAEFSKAMPKVLDRITKEIVSSKETKFSDRASSPYDGKTLYADSEVYDYSFMVSLDPMTVKTMPPLSTVKIDGRISQAKTVELGLKNAASIGVKVAEDQYAIKNAYTKRDIILGKGGLQHSLDASNVSRLRTNARLSAIGGYIVQNAVPINGLTKENKQANGTYAMACLLNDGNGFVVAIVTVDEFSSKATNFDFVEITHSINGRFLAKKEDSRSSTRELELGQKSLSTTAISKISIAEFLEIVNSSHQSILSNDVLAHFGVARNPDGHYAKRVLFSDRASQKATYAPTFYSDRNPDSVSNRSLLANALESVAQNDVERTKLNEYKGKIALIESEQAKLSELRGKIKDLSFAKGPRDTEAIKKLQFEANQAANRINTYDRQLLNLESTKALKGVLEREKQMAYKRAEKRGKEALAKYKEDAVKTQRELMTRYQEARKKGVESRNKTEMRHKIKDVVNELNQYLLNGTKEKHVPIELQKAVAEALDAVNMDTVGAEERIANLEAELMKAKTPEKIQEISKKIAHVKEMGDRMDGKLKALKDSYDEIVNSDDPLIANSHDEVISNSIANVIKEVGGTPLRDMTLTQLESVYDLYKMVLTTIRNTNKAFKAAKSEEISVIANRVMDEIDQLGKKKLYKTKAEQFVSKFDWNNLKPVYAFERIGSDTFTEVFDNVRAGEDVWAVDVTEAKEFSLEQHKKYKYDSWDFKKRFGFISTSGMHFELSLDQIMSLYAYSKRKQAADHLKKGGIVFDETTEVTLKTKLGVPVKFNPTQATAYNLSDETLADIISKLSPEQKEFVDVMQDYLSTTMGEKGNEVSLALYGVKLYKEKHYFPLKSATQFMAKAKEQQKGEVKVKNSGFSKETVAKASNPIVLTPFMDVWADHVNEMSMYHAFVLPLEDFYRVYNYKTPTSDTMATESVEMFLQNAYGKAATQYIDQLLKDLNGGARVDPTVGIINKLTGLFKKSAVFASASVVIQQPSAIARATALIDAKYFVGKPSTSKHSEVWAEVKKYAPVAIIKEMGYFDTGMGQSTVEWLKGEKTLKDKIDDVASKAPSLADELAWCGIWKAVKREVAHNNPEMQTNSEKFLKLCGERFTEVIVKTQVYDSVLSRSGNMRSKDTGMKMATAFMGEPTTSLNMLENALIQAKRGNKRYARKAVGAVVASMVLNSILVSFVYAGRDDDEEKTYAEKYIGTLTEELIDSLNPLTLIPFVKDIVSIAQGYDVERSDMAIISDLIKAWNNLENDNRSAYRKVEDFAGAIASLFGLPVKNIMRDARAMYNTVNSFINGEETTGAGIENAITEAITGKEKSNGQQLYDAMINGDPAQIERVKSRFENQSDINFAIRKALRENDPRIKEAAEARYNGDIAEYMKIAKEIIAEGNFSQDNIVAAINSEVNKLAKEEVGIDTSKETDKVGSIFKVDDFFSAIRDGDIVTAYTVKEEIIAADTENGKDRDEAEADFNSKFASHLREHYEEGNLSDYDAKKMLGNYGGKSEEEAASKVQYWKFRLDYPDYDLSEEAVNKYYSDVKPSGISIDLYYDYSKQRAKCKGTDSNGDGKTDSGSVKAEVMRVINSLPLTRAQKDALYYLNGWSKSTLHEAPWR